MHSQLALVEIARCCRASVNGFFNFAVLPTRSQIADFFVLHCIGRVNAEVLASAAAVTSFHHSPIASFSSSTF